MKVHNIELLKNHATNASFNSAPMFVQNMFGYAFQIVFTGTPTGSFKLQASCDKLNDVEQVSNWTDVANSSVNVTGAGSHLVSATDVMYNHVRIVYTDTSGGTSTALMSAVFNTKGA